MRRWIAAQGGYSIAVSTLTAVSGASPSVSVSADGGLVRFGALLAPADAREMGRTLIAFADQVENGGDAPGCRKHGRRDCEDCYIAALEGGQE